MTRDGVALRVLVVDDAKEVRDVVARVLDREGFAVEEAANGEEALAAAAHHPPDLVVLDINLPGVGGLEVLSRLRRVSDVPVILLTGRDSETDRIIGLEIGADDYMVKPFSPGELAARVKAVLRRQAREMGSGVLKFGPLTVNLVSRDVQVNDVSIYFTQLEFDLLAFLARSPRQVLSREQLLERVWASTSEWQGPSTVTEHVRRVRQKLERAGDRTGRISTVRGVGYRFEP